MSIKKNQRKKDIYELIWEEVESERRDVRSRSGILSIGSVSVSLGAKKSPLSLLLVCTAHRERYNGRKKRSSW